ncbi:oxygenase MpaB family protein [Promicromonospora sp. NPDC050880]|uniref:oxygenase MpaB family protein n=1 Tax=Promicromonospora sp. NPDC050880 TaxID=3364406 RepID=UPI0037AE1DEE
MLQSFLAAVTAVPDWVDWDLMDEGAAVLRRLGQNAADVLLQLSLVGGYRFGGPTDLLVATGALTGDTLRRLADTQEWTVGLSEPGALRVGGPAWQATVRVRVMHALVGASFTGDDASPGPAARPWDTARWGLPVNQADQAATLGLFDGTVVLGCRALGVPVPPSDSRALMHLWKWVGHLLGVHPDFLVDDEWARHRLNHHVLLAQAGVSDAGPLLAQALVAAQADRTYPGPVWWQPWRAGYERERLLSMLTAFLGVRSMRELGLPLRPPWAHAYLVPLNTWRYRVRGRGARGRARLDRWGRRRSDRILASYQTCRTPRSRG